MRWLVCVCVVRRRAGGSESLRELCVFVAIVGGCGPRHVHHPKFGGPQKLDLRSVWHFVCGCPCVRCVLRLGHCSLLTGGRASVSVSVV